MLNYPHCVYCQNVTDAFKTAYGFVHNLGETVESRIGKTRHLTDMTIVVDDPYQNVCLDDVRNMSLRYMIGEIDWYMSGSNKVADIDKYAKMWNSLTDDGETVNSAYGYRIFHNFGFDQLQYVIDKLKASPYDRQAVIHIKDASNTPTKDTPCTCLLKFTYYDNHLNLHAYMRSNDVWLGLPYDMAFFCVLLQIVAKETGLSVGKYIHTVGDLHLYERHWNKGVKTDYKLHGQCNVEPEGWDYTMETQESIEKMLNGEMPESLVLRELWRMNNAKKN